MGGVCHWASRNLLILGGDKPTAGDQPEAHGGFSTLDSKSLVDDGQGHRWKAFYQTGTQGF